MRWRINYSWRYDVWMLWPPVHRFDLNYRGGYAFNSWAEACAFGESIA